MIATTIAGIVACSYLTMQGASIGIARNANELARARCVAETGRDLAMAYIKANVHWRTERLNGVWLADQPLCNGKISLRVEDGADANGDGIITVPLEGDGDLANDTSQEFTITATGIIERRDPVSNQLVPSATYVARCVLRLTGTDLPSYWALDEGGGNTVIGGEGQVGTMVNMDPTTSWTEGRTGNALRFTGNNGYVTLPDTSAVEITTAGTVGAWINVNSFKNAFAGIVHKGTRTDFADEAYSLQFWTGNKIYWGITAADGSHPNVVSPSAPPAQTWVHVLGTWDSTAMKLYVDGSLVATRNGAVESIRSAGAFNIGAQLNAAPYYSFDGIIDDVRIYNRALSAAEVALLASGGSPQAVTTTYLVDWRP